MGNLRVIERWGLAHDGAAYRETPVVNGPAVRYEVRRECPWTEFKVFNRKTLLQLLSFSRDLLHKLGCFIHWNRTFIDPRNVDLVRSARCLCERDLSFSRKTLRRLVVVDPV